MKLSQLAIKVLRGDLKTKEKIAALLSVDIKTVYRNIQENKPNGPLTAYAVVELIASESGLTKEQILTSPEKITA